MAKKSRQSTGKVLVLRNDNRSFLAVIRSLGRRKLCVHVGWFPPDCAAVRSKYVAKAHDIPPYYIDDDSWKDTLISIMRQEDFDLVIPCDDRAIIPLHLHKSEIEEFAPISLPDEYAFNVVFDKVQSDELAGRLGISVPRETVLSDNTQVNTILSQFQLPVVLKPRASFTQQNLVEKNHVRKAYRPEDIYAYFESSMSQGGILVQQNFIGTGVGISVLADKGELLLSFQHMRVHEPVLGGGSSYRKSMPLQPDILEATGKLMKALNYTGVAMVEFKVNFKTGDWIFVEINGRFWGSLPLAIAAGADFPYYLYQLLVEGRREFPQKYKTGLYCRNLVYDASWMIQNLQADRRDPSLATLPLWKVMMEFLNIITFRERSDTFVMDDLRPAFVEVAHFARLAGEIVIDKVKLSLLSLPLVRNIYMRRARNELGKAKSVLFVCKGNIYRSPFAQYYAKKVLPDSVEIKSAGYYPEKERVCPGEAVETARELGVDLTVHRSAIITEEIVRQAQVIFTFDEENRRSLIRRYPFARTKTHHFGLLAPRGSIAIKDPCGSDVDNVRSVYRYIVNIFNLYAGLD